MVFEFIAHTDMSLCYILISVFNTKTTHERRPRGYPCSVRERETDGLRFRVGSHRDRRTEWGIGADSLRQHGDTSTVYSPPRDGRRREKLWRTFPSSATDTQQWREDAKCSFFLSARARVRVCFSLAVALRYGELFPQRRSARAIWPIKKRSRTTTCCDQLHARR